MKFIWQSMRALLRWEGCRKAKKWLQEALILNENWMTMSNSIHGNCGVMNFIRVAGIRSSKYPFIEFLFHIVLYWGWNEGLASPLGYTKRFPVGPACLWVPVSYSI